MRIPTLTTAFTVAFSATAFAQATMEPPKGFVRVDLKGNGETLVCTTGGVGSPMLLLHGWPQTAAEWNAMLPALAERHTVYACDLPGIRDSTNHDDDFAKADMAEDIHAALTDAAIEPMHVVGHDIGVMVAYAFADAYPESTLSLTLMESALPGTEAFDTISANPDIWHFAFHQAPDVPERIVGNDVEYYVTYFMTTFWFTEPGPTPEDIAPFVEAYKDPDTLHAGFEFYRAFEEDADHNRGTFETPLLMPVLALNGGELWPEPYLLEMMEPLAAHVEGGVIEGAGHWLPEERPEDLTQRILAFARESEANRTR